MRLIRQCLRYAVSHIITGVIFIFVRLRLSLWKAITLSQIDILMFLALISSSFLSFQFVRSGTANVTDHAQVCGLFCVLLMMICGFIQAKVLPTIVYPALLVGQSENYVSQVKCDRAALSLVK